MNYLRPNLKRGNFGEDEEDLIIKLHALLGNRWSLIAGRLPGRTDNEVKNYWNSHLRKKLIGMGIDPNNHRLNRTQLLLVPPRRTNSDDHDQEAPGLRVNDHHDRNNSCCSLPDLNLDLTISIAPSFFVTQKILQ
ncbi:hypothetical protein Dimus_031084 [Dionaea muscipula]